MTTPCNFVGSLSSCLPSKIAGLLAETPSAGTSSLQHSVAYLGEYGGQKAAFFLLIWPCCGLQAGFTQVMGVCFRVHYHTVVQMYVWQNLQACDNPANMRAADVAI